MNKVGEIRETLVALHKDERGGTDAMTGVMMLAVGAIVVLGLLMFGQTAMDFLSDKFNEIRGKEVKPKSKAGG